VKMRKFGVPDAALRRNVSLSAAGAGDANAFRSSQAVPELS